MVDKIDKLKYDWLCEELMLNFSPNLELKNKTRSILYVKKFNAVGDSTNSYGKITVVFSLQSYLDQYLESVF